MVHRASRKRAVADGIEAQGEGDLVRARAARLQKAEKARPHGRKKDVREPVARCQVFQVLGAETLRIVVEKGMTLHIRSPYWPHHQNLLVGAKPRIAVVSSAVLPIKLLVP